MQEQELFKNKTKCTRKEYDTFLETHSRESIVGETGKMGLNIIVCVICLILSIMSKEYKLMAILLVWIVLYFIFKFVIPKQRLEKQEKSNQLVNEYTNTYKFYKYFFRTETLEGNAETFYYRIHKVIETKTNFYIYISHDYAFILSKDGFIDCDKEEFAKFLKKKTKLKYKRKF